MLVAARSEAPLVLSPYWAHSEHTTFLEKLGRVCSSFGVQPERCTLRLRAGRFDAARVSDVNADIERFLAIAPVLPPGLATTLEIADHASVSHQSIENIVRLASFLPRLTELLLGDLVLGAEASERLLLGIGPLAPLGPLGPLAPLAPFGPLANPTALLVLDVSLTCTELSTLIRAIAALTELRALRLRVACYSTCIGETSTEDAWSLTHTLVALPSLYELDLIVMLVLLVN
jgi:hypothetical protein